MTAQNTTRAGEWEEPEATWDEGSYYYEEAEPAVVPQQAFLRRIWTGRPMIYILAAGLVAVTGLVLLTRPDTAPTVATAPVAEATRVDAALITYDAGPVIEPELNKP